MKKLWIDLRRMIITIVLIVLLCLFGFDDIFNLFNEHIEAFIGFIFIVDILIHAIFFVYIYHFDEYKISCTNNPFFKKNFNLPRNWMYTHCKRKIRYQTSFN